VPARKPQARAPAAAAGTAPPRAATVPAGGDAEWAAF
jgi:hypothetical protein